MTPDAVLDIKKSFGRPKDQGHIEGWTSLLELNN